MLTGDIFAQPLKEHIQLKITRVQDNTDIPTPFIIRRLVCREYPIGPEGATIGSGVDATIRLPKEAGIMATHFVVKWVPCKLFISIPVRSVIVDLLLLTNIQCHM